jgi:hypothetical protein
MSKQQPTTLPPYYLHQLYADEGVLSGHPPRMHVRNQRAPWDKCYSSMVELCMMRGLCLKIYVGIILQYKILR